MRARSAEKLSQVQGLLTSLQMEAIPKQKISKDGFLELVITFIDREQYPKAPVAAPINAVPVEATATPQKDA